MLTSLLRDAENNRRARMWGWRVLICALMVAVTAAGCGGPDRKSVV